MDAKNILVVDDDAGLRELLQQYLGAQGYHIATVADGAAMDTYRAANPVDLIILDLMLPGEDGLSLARRLRTQSDLPIIMLSARGEDVDRIVGLEVGADDYLAKPFNPRELLARIRALLRRSDSCHDTSGDTSTLHFGDFALNLDTHDLHKSGSNIPLTAGEFNLLRIFAEHPNRVLSRDSIMDMLKGYERSPFDRSIDVRVTRLRRKIESDPNNPLYIRTVWGEGYLFASGGERV
ncbi:MAG TPA: two-component system response regulator OmpR [Gallionellaceae bacterium]|nr:two-component system response regulator OmpR [Gallionellaceae bacterium]